MAMKARSRRSSLVLLVLAGLLLTTRAASQTGSASPSSPRGLAAQDRARAADARQQAQTWTDIAAKARTRAAASSGSLKASWEQSARDDEATARRLNDEADMWEQKAAQADANARAGAAANASGTNPPPGNTAPGNLPQASASPQTGSNPPPASEGAQGPNPPGQTASGNPAPPSASSGTRGDQGLPPAAAESAGQSGAAPATAQPTAPRGGDAAKQACSNQSTSKAPLTADQIIGFWRDTDTGEEIEIKEPSHFPSKLPRDEKGNPIINLPLGEEPPSAVPIIFDGHHQWEGTYEAGKLKVRRFPEPGEMGHGPDWARQEVKNRVEWKLELDAKIECDQPVLTGKWYPGSFKWSEELDPEGTTQPKRTVSDIGPGDPIDKKYRLLRPPMIQLLAQTIAGPIKVSRLFQGVPTVIEAVFDEPQPQMTKNLTVTIADRDLKLIAKRDPADYRRFVTDIIVPAEPGKGAGGGQ